MSAGALYMAAGPGAHAMIEKSTKRRTVTIALGQPLFMAEKEYILRTLEACDGNQSEAARVLQVNRNTLRAKLKEYGVVK